MNPEEPAIDSSTLSTESALPILKEQVADKTSLEALESQVFKTNLGQEVSFYKESGEWKAKVAEKFGCFNRERSLNAYFDDQSSPMSPDPRQIHVVEAHKATGREDYVYVGRLGLLGGVTRGENDGKNEMEDNKETEKKTNNNNNNNNNQEKERDKKKAEELLKKAYKAFKDDIEIQAHREMVDEDGGVDLIMEYIQDAGYETELDLRDYDHEIEEDSDGYRLLAEGLPHSKIKELYLPSNVGHKQLELIIQAFYGNNTIKKFGFSNQCLEDSKLHTLLFLISFSTPIESLNLRLVDFKGINNLIPSLLPVLQAYNEILPRLKELNLSFTASKGSLGKLFSTFTTNNYIRKLKLDIESAEKKGYTDGQITFYEPIQTPVQPTELEAIKQALMANTTLEELYINGEDITDDFADMLFEVIDNRPEILNIEFGENTSISKKKKEEISKKIIDSTVNKLFNEAWDDDDKIISMIEVLKSKNFDFNTRFEKEGGYNLMHQAIYNGNLKILKLLVRKYQINPKLTTTYDRLNIVHIAAARGNVDLLKELFLDYKDLFDCLNEFGHKPVHYSVSNGTKNDNLTAYLIDNALDIKDFFVEGFIEKLIENLMPLSLRKVMLHGVEVTESFYKILNSVQDGENKEKIRSILSEFEKLQKQLTSYVESGKSHEIMDIFNQGFKINFSNNFGKILVGLAFKHRQYDVCALLMSRDKKGELDFARLAEDLDDNEKKKISIINSFKYLDYTNDAIVDYMSSKIRMQGDTSTGQGQDEFIRKLKNYLLTEVCTNSLLKPILEAIIFVSDLQITIDLSRDNTSGIYISCDSATKGVTAPHRSEIYIGAKKDFISFAGTLVHECCHLVCHLVWDNGAAPYSKDDTANKKDFEKISQDLKKIAYSEAKKELIEIITDFLGYDQEKWPNELIARVPQVIISHQDKEKYFTKFSANHSLNLLFKYYSAYFLDKTNEFILKRKKEKLQKKLSELNNSNLSLADFNL